MKSLKSFFILLLMAVGVLLSVPAQAGNPKNEWYAFGGKIYCMDNESDREKLTAYLDGLSNEAGKKTGQWSVPMEKRFIDTSQGNALTCSVRGRWNAAVSGFMPWPNTEECVKGVRRDCSR